jgi:hypothetical protein
MPPMSLLHYFTFQSAGVSKTVNVSVACSTPACPSGVSWVGVVTLSCQNMVAMSDVEEEAVTGLGLKMGR